MIKDKKENAVKFIFEMCDVGESIVNVVCNMLQSGFLTREQMDKLLVELVKKQKIQAKITLNYLNKEQIDYSDMVRIK